MAAILEFDENLYKNFKVSVCVRLPGSKEVIFYLTGKLLGLSCEGWVELKLHLWVGKAKWLQLVGSRWGGACRVYWHIDTRAHKCAHARVQDQLCTPARLPLYMRGHACAHALALHGAYRTSPTAHTMPSPSCGGQVFEAARARAYTHTHTHAYTHKQYTHARTHTHTHTRMR